MFRDMDHVSEAKMTVHDEPGSLGRPSAHPISNDRVPHEVNIKPAHGRHNPWAGTTTGNFVKILETCP